MSTENQIEANRLNAQHCTGPKTEEGKLRSSQNALKSGLYSKAEVLITESREAYDQLIADFYEEFAPATPQEASLVDALIRYEWLTRRYMAADTAIYNFDMEGNKTPNIGLAFIRRSDVLARAGRLFTQARRGFSQTLKELKALQLERKAEEAIASNTKLQPIQQPEGKLVSFRQPEIEPRPEPQSAPKPDEQNDEAPPKAA